MKDKTFENLETIEILADGELSNIIAEIQELETEVKKYDDLQKQLRQKVKELIGDNKRAIIKTNRFELQLIILSLPTTIKILSKRLLIKPLQ
jgi:hypothetical protein